MAFQERFSKKYLAQFTKTQASYVWIRTVSEVNEHTQTVTAEDTYVRACRSLSNVKQLRAEFFKRVEDSETLFRDVSLRDVPGGTKLAIGQRY